MNRVVGGLAVLGLLGVAALTHALSLVFFVVGICGAGDDAASFPADASAQGMLCGSASDGTPVIGLLLLLLSYVASVVAVVVIWRRSGWFGRWLSPLALVAVPVLTLWLLSLPPNTCTDAQAVDHPAADCSTTPDG